jgi:nucleotide-binding universal stress UspA family protein
MKTILAPIDFSSTSDLVIQQAIRLARAVEARLVLLHVLQPVSRLGRDAALAESGVEFAALVETDASRRLAQLQRELMASGVVAHAIHRRGNPGRCIVQQAQRLAADYIVIGSHGHSAVYDLIVGSTTTRVLKDAGCRVVIVPPGMAPPPAPGKPDG